MPAAASAPAWSPQEPGVQQICYLLSEYQKPGTNQSQVMRPSVDSSAHSIFARAAFDVMHPFLQVSSAPFVDYTCLREA